MSFNKVIVLGNLTRDPETRYSPAGLEICTFGLAMNHKYKQGEETKEEVCYLDVIVFGKFALVCQKYLIKGQGALVEGRLRQRRWEDKETHAPRSKHELIAAGVQFMPKKQGSGSGGQGAEEDAGPPVDEGDIPF